MTLNQLRAFLAVARLGSFSAAAVALGMTQPSISELVRRLEEEYRLKLFVRGARRLSITAAGEGLLPFAEQAVQAADQADKSLRSLTSLTGGVAIFGLLRNANYYFLSQLIETFHTRYPEVRLKIVGLNSVEVAEAVASGDLEAGLVVLPIDTDGLQVRPLLRSEVMFVSADPERTRAPMTIEGLAAAPLVLYDAHYGWRDPTRRQLSERAQLAGVTLDASVEVEHVESALGVVAMGGGDTIVSRAIVESATFPSGLHTSVFEEPLYDTIAVVQRVGAVLSPATREISRLAQSILLEHADPADRLVPAPRP
ncbi:LysR family transcriptional regulator [Galbitalea soli]|uniref:LysR family transcriptional regulator n=1 Tax=Galbitalea soli TaxID=1268042 RepID=A0A7C9PNS8_9MICO|nr:LysR family transcriptional regulator [Galbitalea soli]NEM91845.1 LysR family transcriptional regulator [Galbitalea soli]NYJ29321.1 DNA-binding transcriptional LysR family regulator [Galbitalea soli]